jgi:multidrug efflux pump subunit AcrB
MFTKILHRPALAIVISILLLFLGGLGIKTLPISQFPNIAPPTVMVAIAYPGASANVLVDAVLIPLEQSINGVQNMRYIASDATSAGEATIQVDLFRARHRPQHQRRQRAEPREHRAEPAAAARAARGHPRQPGRAPAC